MAGLGSQRVEVTVIAHECYAEHKEYQSFCLSS
jgi:hypothetical protein